MSEAFRESNTKTYRNITTFQNGLGVVADSPWNIGTPSTTGSFINAYNEIRAIGGISGRSGNFTSGLYMNGSAVLTGFNSGLYFLISNTGSLTGTFYPRSNPLGYITQGLADSSYLTAGQGGTNQSVLFRDNPLEQDAFLFVNDEQYCLKGGYSSYIDLYGATATPFFSLPTIKGFIVSGGPVDATSLTVNGISVVLASQTGGFGGGGTGGTSETASNLGVGSGLFNSKVGNDLQFKSLRAGAGISITGDSGQLTIKSTASSSLSMSQTEIDFGSTPVSNYTFTIIDAGITVDSKIIGQVAWVAPTNKDIDEIEMDKLEIKCQPSGGGFLMYVESQDGSYLHDKFKVNYLVS